jgi:anti-sigma regulatory factor (Ser/Thr protein kinase)
MNDIRLVVSELVSNAIQHGDGAVEIEVDLSDERWLGVAVTGGDGLPEVLADPSTWTIAPAELPAGRGLGIVRSLVQELSTTNVGGLASVRCRVRR